LQSVEITQREYSRLVCCAHKKISGGVRQRLFRRVLGHGKNLIVYLEHCTADALKIQNAEELMKKMLQMLKRPK